MGRYSRLPELAGPGFLPLGLFARLPLAMLTVGALTLLTTVSGSYAIGGFAAGAVGLGSAAGAPVVGYLADRLGQRPVLLLAAVVNTLAITGLVLSSLLVPDFSGLSLGVVLAAAFMMGGTCPQVGPLARVRWMSLTRNSSRASDLDVALSYESTADELTFVLGPALVGLLASLIAPWLPLALAALLTITLVTGFAVHPTVHAVAAMPGRPAREQQAALGDANAARAAVGAGGADFGTPPPIERPNPRWWHVGVPVAGMVCMGTFFGSTQAGLIAFVGSFGVPDTAGLLYAVMGVSSAVTALSMAYWPAAFSHPSRWTAAAAAMVGLALLLFLPAGIVSMLLVLLLLGLPVGPVMVTIFSIGGIVAPRERLGTVMTMLASGVVAGTAIGSAIAGSLAEQVGYSTAFMVPVCAAVGLALLGAASLPVTRGRELAQP